jgi:hypothetical protein
MYEECRGRNDLVEGATSTDMMCSGGAGSVACGGRRLDRFSIRMKDETKASSYPGPLPWESVDK